MNAVKPTFADVLAGADIVHRHEDLLRTIEAMGARIDAALDGDEAVFITVMNGALIFAGHLALAIRSPLRFDYAHATRYHDNSAGHLKWLRRPVSDLRGRKVLLVDDILDEGHTLAAIRDECLRAGAEKVWLAALCVKHHGRRHAGIEADFAGVAVPDKFVFGFGMDWDDEGRNLPHVYAPGQQEPCACRPGSQNASPGGI